MQRQIWLPSDIFRQLRDSALPYIQQLAVKRITCEGRSQAMQAYYIA